MRTWTRREWLEKMLWGGLGLCLTACRGSRAGDTAREAELSATPDRPLALPAIAHEARFYRRLDDRRVHCQLCFRKCIVAPGGIGFCRNKMNIDGTYFDLIYGRPSALQIDPMEKEPCFHVLPGSRIFGIGTASCNNRCRHCHNWHLSQRSVDELFTYEHTPREIVNLICDEGCEGVSFTYNEPTVFYDYMFDIARLAKEQGIVTLFHTNGGMEAEPLFAVLEHMDAVTVDLKAFTPQFYREVSESELKPVLHTLENIRKTDVHLEIVNLVIPGYNDDLGHIRAMCRWIIEHLGDEVPTHFTRFFPAYKLDHLPATPVDTLNAAANVADDEGLRYVYVGNVPGHERNSTFCPACGRLLIHRMHFQVLGNALEQGKCPECGEQIPGIWGSEIGS